MSVSKFHSSPAYTFGGSRSRSLSSLNPGPGTYNPTLKTKQQQPSWRMGTASRSTEYKKDTPGPGSYDLRSSIKDGPKYHIAGKHFRDNSEKTPGPGSYNVDVSNIKGTETRAPSYTMRPKTAGGNSGTKVPGPGAYDQTSRILNQSVCGVKIGTGCRGELYDGERAAPGPGAYNLRPSTAGSGPKYGFGTSKKGSIADQTKNVPGPGSYVLRSAFEKTGAGSTMVPKRPLSASVDNPGPGAYDPKLYGKQNLPAWKIGTASRDGIFTKSQAPGPGAYDPSGATKPKAPAYGMGTSVRRPLSVGGEAPGPGSYEFKSTGQQAPLYTMVGRKEDFHKNRLDKSTPGPGAYNPSVNYAKERPASVGIGTGKRQGLYTEQQGPGPGYYNLKGGPGGPRWGFGTQSRDEKLKGGDPGPGAYNIPSTIADVPKYVYGGSPLKIRA